MDKFTKLLLLMLLLFFGGLIVTSGTKNLGLYEGMENKDNEENPAILKTETHEDKTYDF
jgi:hypothetical protein|uniref:Uncharacterized protein n=1 Tax=viral metagenome TaxID=1070528 RepID=A0A6C0IPJ9_9ZZZZ